MNDPTLQGIPLELQTAIVSYIRRPSDLKSLCLTCKQLGATATEKLYNAVYLDVGRERYSHSFFMVNHRGRQHIRSLTFAAYSNWPGDDINALGNASIRLALQLIPRNILKHVETPWKLELEPETVTTLFTQQMALETISLAALGDGVMDLPIDVSEYAPKLRGLSAYFYDRKDGVQQALEFYGDMIQTSRLLRCLDVRTACDSGDDALIEGEDRDAIFDHRTYAAFTNFFGHLEVSGTKDSFAALPLEELHFRNLHLEHPSCHFTKVVQYENLQWLTIHRCDGGATLFQHMATTFGNNVAKLRGYTFYHDDEYTEAPLKALQLFLQSFSGLEYLAIEHMEPDQQFDLGFLNTHMASLQHLLLSNVQRSAHGGRSDRGWSMALVDLQALVSKAPRLRQLALAFPKTGVQDFVNDKSEQYDGMLDAIATLSKLEILHVLSWPEPEFNHGQGYGNRGFEPYYLRQHLDCFANRLVRRIVAGPRKTKLSAVCFGDGTSFKSVRIAGTDMVQGLSKRPFYVVERSGTSSEAVRTDRSTMRYREPMLNLVMEDEEWGGDVGMSSGGIGQFDALR